MSCCAYRDNTSRLLDIFSRTVAPVAGNAGSRHILVLATTRHGHTARGAVRPCFQLFSVCESTRFTSKWRDRDYQADRRAQRGGSRHRPHETRVRLEPLLSALEDVLINEYEMQLLTHQTNISSDSLTDRVAPLLAGGLCGVVVPQGAQGATLFKNSHAHPICRPSHAKCYKRSVQATPLMAAFCKGQRKA